MKIEIELPDVEEGLEYTGEYRAPKMGEWYLGCNLQAREADHDFETVSIFPILKPVEKWIVPTLEYMQKHYKWGETVKARFRDRDEREWRNNELILIRDHEYNKYISPNGVWWKYCEIKVKP